MTVSGTIFFFPFRRIEMSIGIYLYIYSTDDLCQCTILINVVEREKSVCTVKPVLRGHL